MTDRIRKLCSYLSFAESFADVGCDHGYCTEYMLKNSLCRSAIISDISPQSLQKAQNLLSGYIQSGVCTPVCCNGLTKIPPSTELVLIAGMGGEEIISVLDAAFIPRNFVLQPMKNVPRLRQYLLSRGVRITRDSVFKSGKKYYFVLCGSQGGKGLTYTPARLKFGFGDIDGDLGGYLREELKKLYGYLSRGLSPSSRSRISEEISFTEGFLKGEIV